MENLCFPVQSEAEHVDTCPPCKANPGWTVPGKQEGNREPLQAMLIGLKCDL